MERMDAETPAYNPEMEETPVALRLMGTSFAALVEMGITLEEAHKSEVRAHRDTRFRRAIAEEDAQRYKRDYLGACKTIADMHAAAFGGEVRGPGRGVVEDMADLCSANTELRALLATARRLLAGAVAPNDFDSGGARAQWRKDRNAFVVQATGALDTSDREPEPEPVATQPMPTSEEPDDQKPEWECGPMCEHAPDGGNHPSQRQSEGMPMPTQPMPIVLNWEDKPR